MFCFESFERRRKIACHGNFSLSLSSFPLPQAPITGGANKGREQSKRLEARASMAAGCSLCEKCLVAQVFVRDRVAVHLPTSSRSQMACKTVGNELRLRSLSIR